MTDNSYLFCDMNFNNCVPLEKFLDPLLARLPEEKRKILAPNGVKDTPREYVRSHSIFCRFRKTCTCEKVKYYSPAQFVLSDRRPAQPYTETIANELRRRDEIWRQFGCDDKGWHQIGCDERLMDRCAHNHRMPWGSGSIWNLEWVRSSPLFQPIWRQIWDTVTVTEHEHSQSGATLWQPIGNGLYEWAHVSWNGRQFTGLGRIEWDAEGNARLFRVTEQFPSGSFNYFLNRLKL